MLRCWLPCLSLAVGSEAVQAVVLHVADLNDAHVAEEHGALSWIMGTWITSSIFIATGSSVHARQCMTSLCCLIV